MKNKRFARSLSLSRNATRYPDRIAVRVKGGMSLRNGMWHGLRNDIIMRNLIYADRFQRNKLN